LLGGASAPNRANESAAVAPMPPAAENGGERVQRVPVTQVRAGALQPRKDFSPESLQELADSIKEQGIVQPLIVRERGGYFELIAGERRWRAAQMAGLAEVPVIVREANDSAALEWALIENLQRENLNAIEEALGFAQLIGQFQWTQEQAATKVGKSRAVVANALRLLKLPPELQAYIREGRLSVGHAKVLLGLDSAENQKLAAERILQKSLNVRQTEELVNYLQAAPAKGGTAKAPAPLPRDAHLASVQSRIQERFGTKVVLRYHEGKGAVEIRFFNDADLERILKVAGIDLD
jgi:ParB family chromosome partitioning protein